MPGVSDEIVLSVLSGIIPAPAGDTTGVGVNDTNRSIWVADSLAASIFELKEAKLNNVVSQFQTPSNTPRGVELDENQCIWSSDAHPGAVFKIHRLTQTGTLERTVKPRDKANAARGIGFDDSNCIYVQHDASILRGRKDNVLEQVVIPPSDGNPRGLEISPSDCLWTSSQTTPCLLRFDQTGTQDSQINLNGVTSSITGVGQNPSTESLWLARGSATCIIIEVNKNGSEVQTTGFVDSEYYGIDATDSNSIWVSNADGSITKISPNGGLASTTSLVTRFDTPTGQQADAVGVDACECIWFAGSAFTSIFKTDINGSIVKQFTKPSEFINGAGADVNSSVWLIWQRQGGASFPDDHKAARVSHHNKLPDFEEIWDTPSSGPKGIDVDTNSSIWLADGDADSVYRMNPLAGHQTDGFNVSNFARIDEQIQGVGVDASGSIWFGMDNSNIVFRVTQGGSMVTSFQTSSSEVRGLGVDGNDSIWTVEHDGITNADVIRYTQSGVEEASFNTDTTSAIGLGTADPGGVNSSIWVADADSFFVHTRAGGDPASEHPIPFPASQIHGLEFDQDGSIWMVDPCQTRVFKTDASADVKKSFTAPSTSPCGLGVDPNDNSIWIGADVISLFEIRRHLANCELTAPCTGPWGVGMTTESHLDGTSEEQIWIGDNDADSLFKIRTDGTIARL